MPISFLPCSLKKSEISSSTVLTSTKSSFEYLLYFCLKSFAASNNESLFKISCELLCSSKVFLISLYFSIPSNFLFFEIFFAAFIIERLLSNKNLFFLIFAEYSLKVFLFTSISSVISAILKSRFAIWTSTLYDLTSLSKNWLERKISVNISVLAKLILCFSNLLIYQSFSIGYSS